LNANGIVIGERVSTGGSKGARRGDTGEGSEEQQPMPLLMDKLQVLMPLFLLLQGQTLHIQPTFLTMKIP